MGVAIGLGGALWAADAPRVSTVGVDARTGRLVRVPATRYSRSVADRTVAARPVPERVVAAQEVKPLDASRPVYNVVPPRSFDEMVRQIAYRYGIRPSFVHAVIKAESNYNPRAISSKGALGLMQLMPQTARQYGVKNVFDPAQNIEGGVRHLRRLLDLYDQTSLTLAAYNAGEGAVGRYRGVPPYSETRQFVRRVNRFYQSYRSIADTAAPEAPPVFPKRFDGPRIFRSVDSLGVIRYTTDSQ